MPLSLVVEPMRLLLSLLVIFSRSPFSRSRQSASFLCAQCAFGDLSESLPEYAIAAIREALPAFNKQIKGFAMDDAMLTGVETRTSSPIRIKRNEKYQSLNVEGLFLRVKVLAMLGGFSRRELTELKSLRLWL